VAPSQALAAASLSTKNASELTGLLKAAARAQMTAEAHLAKCVSEGDASVAAVQALQNAKVTQAKGKAKQTAEKARDKAVAGARAQVEQQVRLFQKQVEDAEKHSQSISDELAKRASVAIAAGTASAAASAASAAASAAPTAALASVAPAATSSASGTLSAAATSGPGSLMALDTRALAAALHEHFTGNGDNLLKAQDTVRSISAIFKSKYGSNSDEDDDSVYDRMTKRVLILKGSMAEVMTVAGGSQIQVESVLALLHKMGAVHAIFASVSPPGGAPLSDLLKATEGGGSDDPKQSAQMAATHLSKLRGCVFPHLRKAFNGKQAHYLQMFVSWLDHLTRGAMQRALELPAQAKETLLADVAHAESWARACEDLKLSIEVMQGFGAVKSSAIVEFCSQTIEQAEASNGAPPAPHMWSHKHENKVKRKVDAARVVQDASDMTSERERDDSRDSRKRKEASYSTSPPLPPPARTPGHFAVAQVCRDFQQRSGCTYKNCRYEHVCIGCKGKGHGESSCRTSKSAVADQNGARDQANNGSYKARKMSDSAAKTEVKSESEAKQ
jgi:hypothetical protein